MGNPIEFPDISFYQDDNNTPRGVDVSVIRRRARCVLIRAGQNMWPDPDFKVNWAAAKAAGLARGSYWFYDSRVSPAEQFREWRQQLGDDLGELPHFVDVEESYGGPYGGYQKWYELCALMLQIFPKHLVGMYTRFYYFRDLGPSSTDVIETPTGSINAWSFFKERPLWIANYGVSVPKVPLPWNPDEWVFWQYTETGDGKLWGAESNTIDLNYGRGDEEWLEQTFNIQPTPPPATPLEEHFWPHMGIEIWKVRRFNSWCHLALLDPKYVRTELTVPGLKTCSQVAALTGAQFVVNGGDFFSSGRPRGLYYRKGDYIAPQEEYQPFLHWDEFNKYSIRDWNTPGFKYNALAGKRMLVENGNITTHHSTAWYEVHPRTLTGVHQDSRLMFAVVDGRQPGYSDGIDLFDGAKLLIEFGAHRATDLDGGGSSTMVIDGQVYNRPIDMGIPFKERPVGDHAIAFAGTVTPGVRRAEEIFSRLSDGSEITFVRRNT